MIYYNDNITPAFRTWCVENYSPKPVTPSYTTLYYSDNTSSTFTCSTFTWSEVGKASSYATNTSVIQAIGGTNCTTISDYAFYYCRSLTTASFPSCTMIGSSAFYSCYSLTTASFPSCTTICEYAFFGCYNLTSINIPNTVMSIGACGLHTTNILSAYTTSQTVADSITQNVAGYLQPSIYVYLNGTLYKTVVGSCFPKGTKITLADNSKKNIEDLTYDDTLKVWDFDEGKEGTASICWLTSSGLKNNHYYKLTFSDGTVLTTTGTNSNHKVYNVTERYFKGVDKTEVGDQIWSENGIVTVTNKEYIEAEVEYYNLITTHKINCYAEGILTSDRYGNMYPIDENMKYVKNDRQIRPYSEFEAEGIEKYWYDNLRLGELDETIEITHNYIAKLRGQMRDPERPKEYNS